MITYYKATQPDGTDFHTGTVDYARALREGSTIVHPDPRPLDTVTQASGYLSISVAPAETLLGGSWPCRLFTAEPVGEVGRDSYLRHKRTVKSLRVTAEVPAWKALGPQGESVAGFLLNSIYEAEFDFASSAASAALDAALDAAFAEALSSARHAALSSARHAALDAARLAARRTAFSAAIGAAPLAVPPEGLDTVRRAALSASLVAEALLTKDLTSRDQFCALVKHWYILTGQDFSLNR